MTKDANASSTPIRLPRLPKDYANIWWDHVAAAGGNPAAYALRYTLYREAVGLLRGGGLALPTHVDGPTIADAIEHWVLEQFVARAVAYTPGDNAYHDALQGYLYEEAVRRLRAGAFRVDGATAAADALDHWVRREFVKRIDEIKA